jgi:hypothetical protein
MFVQATERFRPQFIVTFAVPSGIHTHPKVNKPSFIVQVRYVDGQ